MDKEDLKHFYKRLNATLASVGGMFINKLERRGIRVYKHTFTKGYPTDVETIVSEEGYGANPYIEVTKPLVVVTGPGGGSGKLATCLSQLYHGVKMDFLLGDLYEPVGRKKFDLIISNPPYIPREVIGTLEDEVRRFEPQNALDGGPDGLDFYHKIIKDAPAHLNKVGWLVLEIGHDQGEAVTDMKQKDQNWADAVLRAYPNKDIIDLTKWCGYLTQIGYIISALIVLAHDC